MEHDDHAVHASDCDGSCPGTYTCRGCERACGWCFGAADEHPDLCDDCWAAYVFPEQ